MQNISACPQGRERCGPTTSQTLPAVVRIDARHPPFQHAAIGPSQGTRSWNFLQVFLSAFCCLAKLARDWRFFSLFIYTFLFISLILFLCAKKKRWHTAPFLFLSFFQRRVGLLATAARSCLPRGSVRSTRARRPLSAIHGADRQSKKNPFPPFFSSFPHPTFLVCVTETMSVWPTHTASDTSASEVEAKKKGHLRKKKAVYMNQRRSRALIRNREKEKGGLCVPLFPLLTHKTTVFLPQKKIKRDTHTIIRPHHHRRRRRH